MSGPAPRLAADAIVVHPARGVLLVKRRNPPPGWALPGGFVEYGETVEAAVAREVAGETRLMLGERSQFHVVSHPERDPRGHTVSVVFTASLISSRGEPGALATRGKRGISPGTRCRNWRSTTPGFSKTIGRAGPDPPRIAPIPAALP